MTAPQTVTSPRHAGGQTLYFMAWALGIAYMTGWAKATSLEALTNQVFVGVWAICLGAAGAWGFLSTRAAHYSRGAAKPLLGAMRDEFWSCAGVAVALLGYELVILINIGILEGAALQILVAGVGWGCARRALQIRRELREVRASLEHPEPADPSPLGKSTSTDER